MLMLSQILGQSLDRTGFCSIMKENWCFCSLHCTYDGTVPLDIFLGWPEKSTGLLWFLSIQLQTWDRNLSKSVKIWSKLDWRYWFSNFRSVDPFCTRKTWTIAGQVAEYSSVQKLYIEYDKITCNCIENGQKFSITRLN